MSYLLAESNWTDHFGAWSLSLVAAVAAGQAVTKIKGQEYIADMCPYTSLPRHDVKFGGDEYLKGR
jgi:hypothetical protein